MKSRWLTQYFHQLNRLQKTIFSCLLKRDYLDRQYDYEKKIHQEKKRLFNLICAIRQKKPALRYLFQPEGIGIQLCEIIFSFNTLKLRIPDHATFEVCQQELEKITHAMGTILQNAKSNQLYLTELPQLALAIENFSALYQSTLRVITADPSVFLFFIQALIDFNDHMERFFLIAPTVVPTSKKKRTPFLVFPPNKNSLRHLFSMMIALCIAIVIAHYFALTGLFLIPAIALFVMQTPIASAFDQGISRLLLVTLFVSAVAFAIHSMPFFYQAMQDICIGALIGITTNIIIFPRQPHVEFRTAMTAVLQAYERYFSEIADQLLENKSSPVTTATLIEAQLMTLPSWVHNRGFDMTLRKGHRFFLITIEQISDVLFSMHYLAGCTYEQELLEKMRGPLMRCLDTAQQFFSGLITLLQLKKLTSPINDFSADLHELEERFQNSITLSLELLDIKRDYVYFAALITNLTELRQLLLKLAQALR